MSALSAHGGHIGVLPNAGEREALDAVADDTEARDSTAADCLNHKPAGTDDLSWQNPRWFSDSSFGKSVRYVVGPRGNRQ